MVVPGKFKRIYRLKACFSSKMKLPKKKPLQTCESDNVEILQLLPSDNNPYKDIGTRIKRTGRKVRFPVYLKYIEIEPLSLEKVICVTEFPFAEVATAKKIRTQK